MKIIANSRYYGVALILLFGTCVHANTTNTITTTSTSASNQQQFQKSLLHNPLNTKISERYLVKRPRWQLGMGFGSVLIPHYAGSNHFYYQPFIFPVFRYYFGTKVQLQGVNVSKRINDFSDISLHFDFRSPVEGGSLDNSIYSNEVNNPGAKIISHDNYHRRGMENLSTILRIGGTYNYRLTDHSKIGINPLINLTVENEFKNVGYHLTANIEYNLFPSGARTNLIILLSIGFGDQQINQYYYQVENSEALSDRPAYQAKPGEIERVFSITHTTNYNDRLISFSRFNFHDFTDSANRNSPLHVSDYQQSFIIGIAYYFFFSEEQVTVSEGL